ncbi:MAG: sigma-70 family RNA polymerase sigma factor [Verrucomicrobiota bacterium]|jgi:RNA polymerase sigma-70 factor (ECF subfamily)
MKLPENNPSGLEPSDGQAARPGAFTTTHWSQVLKAGQEDPAAARAALEYLYQVYRLPIYNFICRHYHCKHHDAEDLTQGFFAHLVEKATVRRADQDKGKFRTFLLGALGHFRANERDRILAEKRGGKCQTLSLDETNAPQVGGREPPVPLAADKAFNQDWAFALVQKAREQLEEKYVKEGKSALFAAMEPALLREDAKDLRAQWAVELEMSQEAAEVAFHRLRRRFGRALRHEVAQTVSNPADAEEELRHLLAAIAD